MKEIKMDWETYQKELNEEYLKGMSICLFLILNGLENGEDKFGSYNLSLADHRKITEIFSYCKD